MHGETTSVDAEASTSTPRPHSSTRGARRPGRPPRALNDELPLASPHVDTWQRVAWLLSVSRLHGAGGAYASRSDFVAELKRRGTSADLSRVSRWESGFQPPSARVLSAYESALGLSPGVLVAITSVIARGPGNPGSNQWRTVDDSPAPVEVVEELLERAVSPSASGRLAGSEWLFLVGELTRSEAVVLTASAWDALLQRLLLELGRSAPAHGVTRYEACAQLMSHPVGRRHLIRVIAMSLADPDVQSVEHAVSLLCRDASEASNELVVSLVSSPSPRIREVALFALATKLSRHHYRRQSATRVEALVRAHLGRGAAARPSPALIAVVAQLAPAARQRVLDKAGSRALRVRTESVAQSGTSVDPKAAARMARVVAAAARFHVDEDPADRTDPMLERLVEEALFHAIVQRRWLANLLLSLSPYADALSQVAVELAGRSDATVAGAAWEMVRWTGHAGDPTIADMALAEQEDGMVASAVLSLRSSTASLTAGQVARLRTLASSPDDAVSVAAVAVLGLRSPDDLADLAGSGSATAAAAWWRRTALPADERPPHP